MNIDDEFPLKFYINLGAAEDRRRRMQNLFLDHRMEVERLPAVPKRYVQNARGHWDKGRYALALTQKLALREGRRRGAAAVLVLEDDVVLHPEWKKRVSALELPEDWGIFYFGCQHRVTPEAVSPGLVRARDVWDLHAFAVKAEYYQKVMSVLTPQGKRAADHSVEPSDRAIATVLTEIPAYAAWPNLAWQAREDSSIAQGWINDNYTVDGLQRRWLDAMNGMDRAMAECAPRSRKTRNSETRALYWRPQGMDVGMGDRIRGLAGMLTVAAYAGRNLKVPWYASPACPGEFKDVLQVKGVEVADSPEVWKQWTEGEADFNEHYNVVPDILWEKLTTGWFLTSRVSKDNFQIRWREILQGFRPSGETERHVERLLKDETRTGLLGVHVRRTDALRSGYRKVTGADVPRLDEELLRSLRNHWREGPWQKVVLACDDEETTKKWVEILQRERMPVILHAKEWNPSALRQTSLVDAATDLFLLSRCGKVVASIMGSFAWMASVMGNIPLEVVSGAKKESEINAPEKVKNEAREPIS
jgi:hypothetical protein